MADVLSRNLTAARESKTAELRASAVESIANMANEGKRLAFWADKDGVRKVLIEISNKTELAGTHALRCLAGMANEPSISVELWDDAEGTRATFIAAAAAEVPEERREHAIQALCTFAADQRIMQQVWDDVDGARAVIVAAAALDQPPKMRENAMRAMADFANNTKNAMQMWEDAEGMRVILTHGAAAGKSGPAADFSEDDWTQCRTQCHAMRALAAIPLRDREVKDHFLVKKPPED